MVKMNQEDIKNALLEMLNTFTDFCDAHSLRYYLFGGTLLGAIRHRDFIPWDDDVDILMPRPDYEMMIETLGNKILGGHYELRCKQLKNIAFPFAKIVDTDIVGSAEYSIDDKNLWLDVFPMDGLPDEEKLSDMHIKRLRWNQFMFNWSRAKLNVCKTLRVKIIRFPFLIFAHFRGSEYYCNKIDALARKYDFTESKYAGNIVWAVGPRERMLKEAFLPRELVTFRGKTFYTTKDWDHYLKKIYGDYMCLPPENKRVSHSIEMYRINDNSGNW